MGLPSPLPDDPRKWDGWSKYNSDNFYERLCLDPDSSPSDPVIEENCRQLLIWWQKKLPLKNQPSNPLAQLLRAGLDVAPKYISEARSELLNPERRAQIDAELQARKQEIALEEFGKFLDFALADKILTVEEEESLINLGREYGLPAQMLETLIASEVARIGAQRYSVNPPPQPVAAAPPPQPYVTPLIPPRSQFSEVPTEEQEGPEAFMQMLRMSRLTEDQLDDRRDTFIEMAENLGLDEDEAEEVLDRYMSEMSSQAAPVAAPRTPAPGGAPAGFRGTNKIPQAPSGQPKPKAVMTTAEERAKFKAFPNTIGTMMLFIPSGSFVMGSSEPDAAPNEQPVTKVNLTRFFISRHPITNKQFELFDPTHKSKRAPWANDSHPVVYVSSLDAMKFCQWLSAKEKKKYRLPTEAEWEYAARGTDGRLYPWGNDESRGDVANFADARTRFAWSDKAIDDGFAETSPVGAYPRGASPFGAEDMAGNVFEWCSDYFEDYKGVERTNPRGPVNGMRRVYRGGSWRSKFSSLRTSARNSNIPTYAYNDVGFRIVCETEE